MHPTHDELIGLVHGTADEKTADAVARHVEECAECEETLRGFDTAADGVIQQLRKPASMGQFESESECRNLASVVAVIGRDLTVAPKDATMGQDAEADLGVIRDYQLLAKLGEGGMGAVYKALHTKLQKVVAIKVLPAGRMNDPQAVQRFEREMQAVGRLSHPNIVGAHDAGEHEGTNFLVMEHVAGIDLSGLIRNVGPLPIADACELARQAAVGLQHAHEHDLVHRDIKPSNLMLAPDGQVKILDLGLARLHMGDQPELTSTGQMMGTLDYIAPEQTGDSHDVDIRADIFSLGATLYKLLAGVTPYSDPKYNTAIKRLAALANEPIPRVESRRKDVPAELAAVVSRMLAKDPDERFSTPAEVAQALEPFAVGAEPAALLSLAQHSTTVEDDSVSVESSTFPHVSSFAKTDPDRRHAANTSTEAFEIDSKHLPPELEPTFIRPASENERSTRNPRRTIVACALVGLGILLSGFIVFKLNLPTGTIVLECDPAALEGATITIDGEEFTIKLAGDNQPVTIGFDDRQGQLRITKAGFKAFTKDFEIAVGEDEHSIKVTFEPLMPVAMPDPEPLEWKPGPAENVLHGLIPRPTTFAGIKRWQIETALPRGIIYSAAFSPDGKQLACGTGTGQVRIYDAETLELVDLVIAFTKPVKCVTWSPDGKWLASGGEEPVVCLWDTHTKRVFPITLDRGRVESVSWAPDSNRIAISSYSPGKSAVEVWTVDGKRVASVDALTSSFSAVAWSPNGQWLASGSYKGQVRLWKTEGFEAGPIVEVDDGSINCIAWSADGLKFATGHGGSNKIRIWNTDITPDNVLVGATVGQVHSLSWSPDGSKLVSSGTQVEVHDLADDSNSVSTFSGSNIFGVCWHPDGNHFASVDERRQITLWNQDGTLRRKGPSHPQLAEATVKWSHDGEFLASTANGTPGIWVWSARGTSQSVVKGGRPLAWHPSNARFTGRSQSGFPLWTSDGRQISTLIQPSNGWSIAWSPNEDQLAVGHVAPGLVELWEPGGKLLATLEGHDGRVKDIAWSPDGSTLVTGGADNTARFWKRDGTPGFVMQQSGSCRSVAWNPIGDRIAVSSDTTMIWNIDGTSGPELKGLANGNSVDWSPDGKRLVTGSHDRTVRLWSDEGLPQSVLHEHDGSVYSVDWSPAGSHFASAANDGTTIVWDAQTAEPLWVGVQLGERETATFSAAGQVLDGDPDVLEEHFVYLVETENGQQELLKPSEFQKRIGLLPAATADPDRRAAMWALGIGGLVNVKVNGDGVTVKQLDELPADEFHVDRLDLTRNKQATDAGLKSLRGLKHIGSLTLNETAVTDAGMEHIGSLTSLGGIDLVHTGVGDEGMRHIAGLRNLDYLVIRRTQVTDAGFQHLADLTELTRLIAENTPSGDAGLEHIRGLIKIRELNVGKLTTDDGLKHLSQLKQLRNLSLSLSQVTGTGLVHLKGLRNLTDLNLTSSAITDSEVIRLRDLPSLRKLELTATGITDEGLESLKDLPLTKLTLHQTQITDTGLESLKTLKQLEELSVANTKVTASAVQQFSKEVPKCRITYGTVAKPITIGPSEK